MQPENNLAQEFPTVSSPSKRPMKKILLGIAGVMIMVVGLGAGIFLVRQNQNIESGATRTPSQMVCPITATENILVYSFGGLGVRGDKEGTIGPIPANVPPGTYKITLIGADDAHPDADTQTNETYYVKFYNAAGTEIGQSGSTPDLPDQDQSITSVVNENFVTTENILSMTAIHTDFLNSKSVNSIHPICIAFESSSTVVTTLSCENARICDVDFNPLTADQIKALKPGDTIRIMAKGKTNNGSFDKAKFTINGVERPEVSTTNPATGELYDEYTIPEGTFSFSVKAKVHHKEKDKWI